MESITYTKKAALENVQNGIEFCRKYGIFPGENLNDCLYSNKGRVFPFRQIIHTRHGTDNLLSKAMESCKTANINKM